MNTKISDAAVEAAVIAFTACGGPLMKSMRVAVEAALPHLAADAVPVEIPTGAIVNGAAFSDRLERDYQFECQAGPLVNCSDYVEFRRCFDHLALWASQLPTLYTHPQPAALNEVSGNSGELGGDEREKFDTWLETISVDTTRWGDGNYTDPTAHNYWLAWLAALAATGKQQGGPDGWAFKVIDGKWAVSNPCCGMSHFLHAPSLHAWSCEQRMKPVDSSSQQGGDVQGDGLATLQQDYDNLLAAFDRQVAAAEKIAATALEQDDRIEELEEALAARQPVDLRPGLLLERVRRMAPRQALLFYLHGRR